VALILDCFDGMVLRHATDNRLQFLEIRPFDEQFCQMIFIIFFYRSLSQSAWDHYLSAAPSS